MQTKRKQNSNIVLFAFPGMGKTTYALHTPGAIDLDFGNYRSANKVKKEDEARLLLPFSRLVKYYFRDGFNVLVNEPSLIPLVKQFTGNRVAVALPVDADELVERVIQRSKGDNYHSKDFAKQMKDNIDEWLQGWTQTALKYGISIHWVNYVEEALR